MKKGEPLRFISSGGFLSFQGMEKTKNSVSIFRRMKKTKIRKYESWFSRLLSSKEQQKTKIHKFWDL
ncbi:hypothetical protein RhiirA1_476930 [Rhizophagus irregularis]|uniref:Uncharacterized protein n=1 Tax=Rhizophagus irregularis TaxID=588596 RepID=A0A2N0QUA8_9GLOM|nr:hypothetical protein RhiirA1_476930 [Rhizophagus irregularis]GET51264.1 hypothetical protein RIR_jg40422.t1 [Rhizophagus irregularis DAOM 181602=DAOM 197198]